MPQNVPAVERLLDVATKLSSERDPDRLLELIVDQSNMLLGADRSTLFLVSEEGDYLQSKIALGLKEQVIRLPIGQGVAGWCAANRQLLNLSDAQEDDRHFHPQEKNPYPFPVRSMICAPLLDEREKLHGVIQALRTKVDPFNAEEEHLIRAMASLTTVAIRNALLNRQMEEANESLERKVQERTEELHRKNELLEQIAITDGLTGAFNRRHFEDRLIHEERLGERYGTHFSIVMFDIDHFKQVNDNHGHDAGDAVLRQLADRVRACMRECDGLFRYGGEEFVLLLPFTDQPGGFKLAERLRNDVCEKPFMIGKPKGKKHKIDVSISLGLGCWNREAPLSGEALVKQADEALYQSKSGGRNRTTIAAVDASSN